MPGITIDAVSKAYKNGPRAVDEVSLEVRDGEFMVLVGPSGCGKSTLLKLIAGIEETTGGRIRIGERDVTELDPRKRDIAMVFQNYALYPHLSVRSNLGFGLKLRKTSKTDIAARVDEVAKILGLEEMLERKPGELSGGQRQRVLIARALVQDAQVLLLDEPFTGLDATSAALLEDLLRELAGGGRGILIATHDLEQARRWDRVLCLNRRQIAFGVPAPTLTHDVLTATYGGAIVTLPGELTSEQHHAILPPHHHHHEH
jgi:multiple sugar transport system ATP-binding protein